MTEEKEVWKDIQGYEGKYQVSNLGNVKSLQYRNKHEEHLLNKGYQTNGYYFYTLMKNAKGKNFLIHRLVASHFIPNPDNLPCVNHIDEDKSNNKVDNLEWCSYIYNSNYGTAIERRVKTSADKRPNILQYTLDGKFVKEYSSITEAERCTGIKKGNICSCCKNRIGCLTAGGYIWKYKNNE